MLLTYILHTKQLLFFTQNANLTSPVYSLPTGALSDSQELTDSSGSLARASFLRVGYL